MLQKIIAIHQNDNTAQPILNSRLTRKMAIKAHLTKSPSATNKKDSEADTLRLDSLVKTLSSLSVKEIIVPLETLPENEKNYVIDKLLRSLPYEDATALMTHFNQYESGSESDS